MRIDKNFPLAALGQRVESSKLSDVRNGFRPESAAISRTRDTKFTVVVGSLTLPTQYQQVSFALLIRQELADKEETSLPEIYYREM